MKAFLLHWIKSNRIMLINAGSLISTNLVTSGLGFIYWWLAARLFPPEAVGLASAAISAMMLLGTISLLGLGNLLINELPRQTGSEQSLVSTAVLLVGGTGSLAGVFFALSTSMISKDLRALQASPTSIAIFTVGVGLTAITLVIDQAVIGFLRSDLQLWRNTLFASIKLIAILIAGLYFAYKVGLTIYFTWAIGNLFSLLAILGFVFIKGKISFKSFLPQRRFLHIFKYAALQHHILNLVLLTPNLVLPIIVTIVLSARLNALFYISLSLAGFISSALYALTIVLNAINAAEPTKLKQQIRLTLSLSVVTCILANCIFLVGAKQILGLFGPIYAEQAAQSLYILGLGTFPTIVKDHYIAICRIHRKMNTAIIPVAIGALLELAGSIVGGLLGGLTGLSLGWVLALVIEALYLSPTVYRAICSPSKNSIVKMQPGSEY